MKKWTCYAVWNHCSEPPLDFLQGCILSTHWTTWLRRLRRIPPVTSMKAPLHWEKVRTCWTIRPFNLRIESSRNAKLTRMAASIRLMGLFELLLQQTHLIVDHTRWSSLRQRQCPAATTGRRFIIAFASSSMPSTTSQKTPSPLSPSCRRI